MKRNASATAQAQPKMKKEKGHKVSNVSKAVAVSKSVSSAKVDTNKLSEKDLALIGNIDARLQETRKILSVFVNRI